MVPEFVDDTSTIFLAEQSEYAHTPSLERLYIPDNKPFGSIDIGRDTTRHNDYLLPLTAPIFIKLDAWPNGKALDYESRDSRFDP
jgi:hypothetical protein